MDPRYEFGENWARYSDSLPDNALHFAKADLAEHVGDLSGCTFLDVGSGSGLMSLAALEAGAEKVLAFDYDSSSVVVTRRMLEDSNANSQWDVQRGDILVDDFGKWDIVYAWGVLHHTGDVRTALQKAADCVEDGGRLVVGIYKRTALCAFWEREKRWYSTAPRWQRRVVMLLYLPLLLTAWAVKGTLLSRLRHEDRGMRVLTDADDWLGGYPYESMTLEEIKEIVTPRGFTVEAEFPIPDRAVLGMGWAGTGCQTIRFRREGPNSERAT